MSVLKPVKAFQDGVCCAEVMRDTNDGAEILNTADLDPDSLRRVIEMRQVAFESWWAPEHPGWGIIDEAPPDGGLIYSLHSSFPLYVPVPILQASGAIHRQSYSQLSMLKSQVVGQGRKVVHVNVRRRSLRERGSPSFKAQS